MIRDINYYLNQLKVIKGRQQERLASIRGYSDTVIKPLIRRGDHIYYGAQISCNGKVRYIGDDSKPEIRLIREARYLSKSIETIDKDIVLLEHFLERYESISFVSINGKLPKTYRSSELRVDVRNKAARKWKQQAEAYKATFDPYRPEELIHRTADGSYTRSRGEALIYNYLLEAGYTFVYELPLKGETRTFFPDFTILSEIDYKTEIRIEHQGMYSDNDYRRRSEAREYDYWINGYLPGRDVYFTYDDNKGAFDIIPIIDILKMRIRPE